MSSYSGGQAMVIWLNIYPQYTVRVVKISNLINFGITRNNRMMPMREAGIIPTRTQINMKDQSGDMALSSDVGKGRLITLYRVEVVRERQTQCKYAILH